MTAISHVPGGTIVLRMARLTWFRHRWAVATILAVFGAATLVLLAEGIALRAWLDGAGLAHCLPGSGSFGLACRDSPALAQLLGGDNGQAAFFAGDTAHLLLAVPPVAALFAGLPWVTREFETGSFRYTWVQGINPVRWLLGTYGSLTAIAAAGAVVCGLVFDWWYRTAQWTVNVTPSMGWDWDAFGLSPIALVGWTVFAMALAMLAGAAIRRTVPAMAAFAVCYAACLAFAEWWLRQRLLTIMPVVRQVSFDAIQNRGDYGVNGWMTGPDGHVLTAGQQLNAYLAASHAKGMTEGQWLTAHHYADWIAYQPHDRLVIFQLAVTLALLVLAALSVLTAVRLLSRDRGVRGRAGATRRRLRLRRSAPAGRS